MLQTDEELVERYQNKIYARIGVANSREYYITTGARLEDFLDEMKKLYLSHTPFYYLGDGDEIYIVKKDFIKYIRGELKRSRL